MPISKKFCQINRNLRFVLGAAAYYLLIGSYQMAPSWVSKTNTTLQIVLGLALVFSLGAYELPTALLTALVYGVCVTTVLSGLDYVWTWGRKAYREYGQRHKDGAGR